MGINKKLLFCGIIVTLPLMSVIFKHFLFAIEVWFFGTSPPLAHKGLSDQ